MIQISTYGTKKTTNNTTTAIGGVLSGSGSSFYPVKLWGQYFDDTEDINGDMQVNGKITADEISSKKISADNMEIDDLNVDDLNAGNINCNDIKADSADINEINTSKIKADKAELMNALIQELAAGNMVAENLTVTKAAHFFELVIDKIKSSGGAVLFTPADGITIDKVEEDDTTYTLYFRATDGENKIYNMWKANDQAICQNFNDAQVGKTYNVSNKYWWSLVTTTNNEDLNGATVDVNLGTEDEPMIQSCHYIKVSKTDCDGKVSPEVGDSVVMLGSRDNNDRDRQSAIYISAYASLDVDLKAPLIVQYRGINDFKLADHKMTWFAAGLTGSGTVKGLSANEIRGNFKVSDGTSLQDAIDNVNDAISNVQNGEDAKMDRIVDAGSYATVVYNDSAESEANRYKLEYNIIFEIHHYEGENMIEVGPTSLPKKFSDYVVKWHYDNRQNATTLTMPTTTNKIQIANNDIPFSMVGGNINNFQYIIVELYDTNDNKLDQLIVPVIMKSAAIFEVVQGEVARITSTVTGSLRQELNNKIISVTNSISRVEQTANGLTSTVTSHTESINTLTGEVESVQNNMSTISQRADEIKAEVTDGLLTSGIDIQAGKIELNSDNTVINGNLNLYNGDHGLSVWNSTRTKAAQVRTQELGLINNYGFNGNKFIDEIYNGTKTEGETFTTTVSYNLGRFASGAGITINTLHIGLRADSNIRFIGSNKNITSVDYTVDLVDGSDNVLATLSNGTTEPPSHVTRGWQGLSIYDNSSTYTTSESDNDISLKITLTFTTTGTASTATSYTLEYNGQYVVTSFFSNYIAPDGVIFGTSNNEYMWVGNYKSTTSRYDTDWAFIVRNKQSNFSITPMGIFRSYYYMNNSADSSYDNIISTPQLWGDISSTLPVCSVSSDIDLTTSNSDGVRIIDKIAVIINDSINNYITVTLPDPSTCVGKTLYFKGTNGNSITISCANKIMEMADNTVVSTKNIGITSTKLISCYNYWVLFS